MKRDAIIYHIVLNFFAAMFIAFFLTLANVIIYAGFTPVFFKTLLLGTLVGIGIGAPVACILSLISGSAAGRKYVKGTKEYSVLFNAVMAILMDMVMNFFIPLANTGSIPGAKPYLDSLVISFGIIFAVGLFTEKYVFTLTDFVTGKLFKICMPE